MIAATTPPKPFSGLLDGYEERDMKRRGFLGFMGGAVAAGPQMAKSFAQEAASGSLGSVGYGSSAAKSQLVGDMGWQADRIKHIQAILSGQDPDARRRLEAAKLQAIDQREGHRLDGMRSIAPQHKFTMLMAARLERDTRQGRWYLENELEQLLMGK